MRVGDEVAFVAGDETLAGVVVEPGLRDGYVAIRPATAAPGAWLSIPIDHVEHDSIRVDRGLSADVDAATSPIVARGLAKRLDHDLFVALCAFVDAGDNGLIDPDHAPINGFTTAQAREFRDRLHRWGLVVYTGNSRRAVAPRRSMKVWRVTARGRAVHAEFAPQEATT